MLRGIRHSIVGQDETASGDGETVGVIDVGSTTVRMVVVEFGVPVEPGTDRG